MGIKTKVLESLNRRILAEKVIKLLNRRKVIELR
jgi:hypothetical protein